MECEARFGYDEGKERRSETRLLGPKAPAPCPKVSENPLGEACSGLSARASREGVFQGVWKKACPSWDVVGTRWQDWLDANVDDVDLEGGALDGSGI